jgi:hypothetical protein
MWSPLEVTQAGVWVTVLLFVLVGVVLVVAAFLDRTRGREIARDLSRPRKPADRAGHEDPPSFPRRGTGRGY